MVKYFVFVTVTVVFLLLPHFFYFLAVVSFFFFLFLLLPCWSREIYTLPGVGFFLDCKYEIYVQTKTSTEKKLSMHMIKYLYYTYFYKNTTK